MLRRFGCAVVLLVALAGGFVLTSCGTIRAGLMVRDALGPAAELAAAVAETDEVMTCRDQSVPVRIYRPRDEEGPLPAVLLIHGAVTDGAFDPRLVSLARAMAKRGGTVATPDLSSLKAFCLDAEDPARLALVAAALVGRSGIVRDGRIALIGISVGGSYGLLAAERPELTGKVSTVLTFGAYADLESLLSRWMTDPRSDSPELLDPQTYGRRLVLRGNLPALVPARDRHAVRVFLDRLLAGQSPGDRPGGLGDAANRVLDVGISEGPVEPEVVRQLLAPLGPTVASLSPVRSSKGHQFPVYLLHGTRDPIVPVADLGALAAHLRGLGDDVTIHETDLFSHVTKMGEDRPSLFTAWSFLSFLADALSDAGY